MKPRTAIVVSCNTPGLAVLRSLARAGIPTVAAAYLASDAGTASRAADRRVALPHPDREESAFVEALEQLASELSEPLIFVASDAALGALARNRDRLDAVATLACPEPEAIELMLDKRETARLAERCGVPSPRWGEVDTEAGVREFCDSVGFPILVKPAVSHRFVDRFHLKMTRVTEPAGLETVLEKFRGAGIVLQELVPATDHDVFNYNAYVVDGEARVELTARQLRKAPPRIGSPCVAVSIFVPEVIELGRALVRGMNLTGFVCIEFVRDERDGRLVVVDINGRPNLSGSLAPRCGIDFPLLEYRHRIEGTMPEHRRFEQGVYWVDLLRDVRYARQRERSGVRDALRPYLSRHVCALWDLRDPAPFAKRAFHALRGAAQ